MQLDQYVGRIVRLDKQAFDNLLRRAKRRSAELENCFLVADISRELGTLICYGGDNRVAVGASEVVLI